MRLMKALIYLIRQLTITLLIAFITFDFAYAEKSVITGADQTEAYLPLIRNKRVGLVVNQTSIIGRTHLVDSLIKLHINIKCVFAPEHGFRGNAEAGQEVRNAIDQETGIQIISLYGDHKKPTTDDLRDIDIIVYDIQDVGARFYTYISTLQLVMEACADNSIPVLVLDRPNPNGFYVDGPVLDTAYSSFVGLNPIPIVYGLTQAEYALMLNGEKWLKSKNECELYYIKLLNWDHTNKYILPVAPSPNLPNMSAVYLYPSLCLFEGTAVSVGRGTEFPFQVIGMPELTIGAFRFKPQSIPGKAVKPLYENQLCRGYDLRDFADKYISSANQLYLFWLIELYNEMHDKVRFFNPFFSRLAGTDKLQKQIEDGLDEAQIRASWGPDIEKYKLIRKKYLLYHDYE
jgi:uncharacterized protein YbbC (DUF1343 family)